MRLTFAAHPGMSGGGRDLSIRTELARIPKLAGPVASVISCGLPLARFWVLSRRAL